MYIIIARFAFHLSCQTTSKVTLPQEILKLLSLSQQGAFSNAFADLLGVSPRSGSRMHSSYDVKILISDSPSQNCL